MEAKATGNKTWLAAGGGAVVGAAAAVAVLLALGWSSADAADGVESLTLPDTAAGLRTDTDVMTEARGAPIEGRQEAMDESAELLSQSRDGAAAGVQAYSDDDLEVRVTVWAVADESPRLWTSQDGEAMAELMGMAHPMQWVERDVSSEEERDVECLMQARQPVIAGSDAEVDAFPTECQLVTDGVTLILQGSGMDSIERPAEILRDVAANLERG